MLSDKPILYWDACVPLSYINGHTDRLPDIEGLMQRSGKDFQIITSILSITEVAFANVEQGQKKLDPEQEEKISKLWRFGSPIQLVELFQLITEKARTLMRTAITKGWSLKPADAIHLATADHYQVTQFHTYDPALAKYKEITVTHFSIGAPEAKQPVLQGLGSPPTTPTQMSEETSAAQTTRTETSTPSDTTSVSGSSSRHTESETTAPIRSVQVDERQGEAQREDLAKKQKPANEGGPRESGS
jgi:predicted nucleic acid-binding protein